MSTGSDVTQRQQRWFASVRAGLERETGRTVAHWAEIATACPETRHSKRLAWMKHEHGLGQNHASLILAAAFPPDVAASAPEVIAEALWTLPSHRALLQALRDLAARTPEVTTGQRKGYTAFSRKVQFAAARPSGAGAKLGLALAPDAHRRLGPRRNESWSERLTSTLTLETTKDIDVEAEALFRSAWEQS